jgi:hypothetical protein
MAIVDKQETCVEALARFLTILTAFHHDLAGSILQYLHDRRSNAP